MGDTYFDTCARLILEPDELLSAIDEWLETAERLVNYDNPVVLMDWLVRDEIAAMERLDELGAAIALAIDLESNGLDSSPLLRLVQCFWPLAESLERYRDSDAIDSELSVSIRFELPLESGTQQERLELFLEANSTLRRFWNIVLYRMTISDDWPTHRPAGPQDIQKEAGETTVIGVEVPRVDDLDDSDLEIVTTVVRLWGEGKRWPLQRAVATSADMPLSTLSKRTASLCRRGYLEKQSAGYRVPNGIASQLSAAERK